MIRVKCSIEKPSIYGVVAECLFFCKITTLKKWVKNSDMEYKITHM